MSAVKPTAELTDREWRIQLAEALRWSSCSCFYDSVRGVRTVTVCRRCKLLHEHDASLASHRQPENGSGEARNARSVEAQEILCDGTGLTPDEIEELAHTIDWDDEFDEEGDSISTGDLQEAATALRAYAKLLRGERE